MVRLGWAVGQKTRVDTYPWFLALFRLCIAGGRLQYLLKIDKHYSIYHFIALYRLCVEVGRLGEGGQLGCGGHLGEGGHLGNRLQ